MLPPHYVHIHVPLMNALFLHFVSCAKFITRAAEPADSREIEGKAEHAQTDEARSKNSGQAQKCGKRKHVKGINREQYMKTKT